MRNHLLTAVGVLLLIPPSGYLPAAADEPALFGVVDGLFDMSDSRALGLDTIPGEHSEIHHATESSGFRFCHHPGLVVFKDKLYCSWSNGIVHEDRPGQRVLYASSTDGGQTWSVPKVLSGPVGERDGCVASGFLVTDQTLVAYYTVRHDYPAHNLHNPKNGIFARTSMDGVEWSRPRRVASGFFIEGPRRLPNGRLLLAGEHASADWKAGRVRMRLLYSDRSDGITGWKEARIDPARASPGGLNVFGYTEPCAVVRPDGVIVSPFRNQSGFLYASSSRDNGATWSDPRQTAFPDSTARFSTGRLPDETLFLINNPGPGRLNRSLLTIALSKDGVTFDRAWLIRGEPTQQRFQGQQKLDGWQYPAALIWRDSLYVAYSVNKEDVMITRIALSALNSAASKSL